MAKSVAPEEGEKQPSDAERKVERAVGDVAFDEVRDAEGDKGHAEDERGDANQRAVTISKGTLTQSSRAR